MATRFGWRSPRRGRGKGGGDRRWESDFRETVEEVSIRPRLADPNAQAGSRCRWLGSLTIYYLQGMVHVWQLFTSHAALYGRSRRK